MPELITVSYFLWIFLSLVTSGSMVFALLKKRETALDQRVKLLLLGMMLTLVGNLFVPFRWELRFDIMVGLSLAIMTLGALIHTQIMLEWKYGKWIWAKVFLIGSVISIIIALI